MTDSIHFQDLTTDQKEDIRTYQSLPPRDQAKILEGVLKIRQNTTPVRQMEKILEGTGHFDVAASCLAAVIMGVRFWEPLPKETT